MDTKDIIPTVNLFVEAFDKSLRAYSTHSGPWEAEVDIPETFDKICGPASYDVVRGGVDALARFPENPGDADPAALIADWQAGIPQNELAFLNKMNHIIMRLKEKAVQIPRGKPAGKFLLSLIDLYESHQMAELITGITTGVTGKPHRKLP